MATYLAQSTCSLTDEVEQWPDDLSSGQQQRVAIARRWPCSLKALLCDEIPPTLDPELVSEVFKGLEQLKLKGMTLILVTPEMNFGNVGDRVVFMHHGKVWETGPSKEVFSKPQSYKAF